MSAGGGPWTFGGERGPHLTDRGNSRRDIGRDGHGRHHVARHRFRESIAGFGYSNVNCYQWRPTAYGWQWVNVCYGYDH
jgi:hypothetical protein